MLIYLVSLFLLIAAFPSYRTKTWRVCFSAVAAVKSDIHCQCFFRQLDNSNYVFIVEYMYLFVTLWQFNISYFSKKRSFSLVHLWTTKYKNLYTLTEHFVRQTRSSCSTARLHKYLIRQSHAKFRDQDIIKT